VPAFLTSNAPFAGVIAAGTALRLIAMVAYRPVLMLQRDAYAYLNTAIDLQPSGLRPALYSALIKPFVVLDVLWVVPVFQHLIGLGIATVLYALLRRLGAGPVVGAVGVVPVLLDGYQLNIEQYLLTETLFEAFTVAALVLVTWTIRPPIVATLGAGALLGGAVLLRFVGIVTIATVVAFALVRRIGWLDVGALAAAFASPLLLYASWYAADTGEFTIANRGGLFLYGRVVEFADCERVAVPTDERSLCPDPDARAPQQKGLFTSGLDLKEAQENPQLEKRVVSFSRRMISNMPADYAAAVASDFARYFEWTSPDSREPGGARWRFPETIDDVNPHPDVARNRGSPPPESGLGDTFLIESEPASFLRAYQGIAWTWGPALVIMVGLGIAGSLLGGWSTRGLGPVAALFTLSALALMLVPTLITVYHVRYVVPALPLLGVAGALGFTALQKRFGLGARARKPPDSPAQPSQVRNNVRV
jgi:hypothetical protein